MTTSDSFCFQKGNYQRLILAIGFVVLGLILMAGGGSDDPAGFSEDLFSFRRLTLAPLVMLIGYGIGFWSIFYKPSASK